MEGETKYVRSPPPRYDDPERATESRDRDRDPYRDSRRSQVDRRRAGRNRSRSPAQIDRYQPDRARDDYYGGRDGGPRAQRRLSPPPAHNIDRYVPGEDRSRIPINQLRDPLFEATQVGFSYFSEWWRTEEDIKLAKERQKGARRPEPTRESKEEQRARIQAAYDDYKLAWNSKMAKMFVQAHKTDDWFRERYEPPHRAALRAQLAEFRKSLFDYWKRDLESGVFDEFTMEGIYKSDSNGVGGLVEKEEGEAAASAEVLAVSDLLPAKGGDLRDPVASLPALLIKTITPAVPREKIEEFCRQHLGEAQTDLKWLSLSDPNPSKKFHRLGWIMLNSEAGGADNGRVKAEEDVMHDDSAPSITTIQDRALNAINDKVIQDPEKGDFTVHVGIHKPTDTARKKALWDLFSAPERIEKDLGLAIRLVNKLDGETGLPGAIERVEERVQDLVAKGLLQPLADTNPVKTETGNEDHDMEDGEEGEEVEPEEVDDENMLITKKRLDLLVEYLRRVHNFCFFCVFETDSVHELQRKCVGGHLRRPRASLTTAAKEIAKASAAGEEFPAIKGDGNDAAEGDASPNDQRKANPRQHGRYQAQKAFNWVKTFEEKIMQVLEPENADLRKLGGWPVDEGMEEELSKWVKQEDASKYRCKVPECKKLFKGVDFWRKHVEKRHTEWYDQIREDLELVNRYVLDPSRLAQGRNDAGSNGHFPVLQGGTPRNFSLNSMGPGGNMLPGSFNPAIGHYTAGGGSSWPQPGGDGGIGPMRNGSRTMNGRGTLPYDRSGRRGPPGRLSPPRGGPPSRGRPSFVEGGIGTFGSAQAVEGRTVKSYNDLDAAGGAQAGAELDY